MKILFFILTILITNFCSAEEIKFSADTYYLLGDYKKAAEGFKANIYDPRVTKQVRDKSLFYYCLAYKIGNKVLSCPILLSK